MAPCITNALCNMSPIIPTHFIVLRSMTNAQIILQARGVLKYILKYKAKRDEDNKTILFANGHTNDIWVGSQFLHNTKIVISAINESKAFQSKRYSSHPTDTEVPDVYCLHLILGYPEVTTDMTFIQNNTGPFENRAQHTVRLDQWGNAILSHAAGDVVGECIFHHSIITLPCYLRHRCSICSSLIHVRYSSSQPSCHERPSTFWWSHTRHSTTDNTQKSWYAWI